MNEFNVPSTPVSAPKDLRKRERALRKHRIRQRRYLQRKRKAQLAAQLEQRRVSKEARAAHRAERAAQREAKQRAALAQGKPTKQSRDYTAGYLQGFNDGQRVALNQ